MDFSLRPSSDLLRGIEAETGLLTRIRSSSEAKPDVFENYWQPLINAIADYVQECPLEQVCFSEPGGLLRYALMSGYYALQIGNQQFFTGKHGAEQRRLLVPQYRFAVFYSTLAGIPALMHSRLIVRAGGKTWTPFHSQPALCNWVRAQKASKFTIEWRLEELKISPANAVAWAADVVGIGTWQNLAEEVALLAHDAIHRIEPTNAESPVTTCVRQAYRTAREFETRAMTGRYQKTTMPDGVTPATIQSFGEQIVAKQTSQATATPKPLEATNAPAAPPADSSADPTGNVGQGASVPAHEKPQLEPAPTKPAESATSYPPIVLDIFKAICAQENYEDVKKSCNETESGIVVPVHIFAKHGLPSSSVLQILQENNLLVQISPTRRSAILARAVRPLLFPSTPR
ncbi:hypothetical protein BLA39750_01333 [Burkholderia lata]|uniref:Uncharacterized domain-containing protein n=1 Tax=Burkholderia lata (strain ATCC 17760 / DSM 23089 / LMG 22485 / NCIMB 9086 / R18194 / 383) TaxID=482957 RepID=A0A6P2VKZ4_BURL3|nr:TraI domain-containing protein [Burkholderia lata]VWC82849.1 hypothetical protein BLA39750_01333 [Burkholderia lata]